MLSLFATGTYFGRYFWLLVGFAKLPFAGHEVAAFLDLPASLALFDSILDFVELVFVPASLTKRATRAAARALGL